MPKRRTQRLDEEFRRALSEIIQKEIRDPRVSPMLGITRVDVTQDLYYAKVYVSVYDEEEKRLSTIEGLNSAGGFLRSKLNKMIRIRRIPELKFILDNSIEYSIHMSKLIDEAVKDIPEYPEETNEETNTADY
ncbi:MAG: 30S ribosome-binding factor RbfA [Christensenellaceae bacterium]|nr:30S ribosome-binding factor RbfA [Christensenellaceae bacterium]MBR2223752.1 30S ribosome-binding factor RbfA [Christensenellaceae bacterium]MBR3841932.1 30S ribosome-binding factor RbfA [Christensenellaceae bacterium]